MKLNFNILKIAFLIFTTFFYSVSFSQSDKVENLYNEASSYYFNDQFTKAEEKYKEILKLDSKNEKGLYGLFLTYNTQKKYKEIINEFEGLEGSFNTNAYKVRYYIYMAEAYFYENLPVEGTNYLRKYFELADDDTFLSTDFLLISMIYFKYEQYDLALGALESFYVHNDEARYDAEVSYLHFKILFNQKEHQKALEKVETTLATLETKAQVNFLLSIIDFTTSDEDAKFAKPYLKKILSETYTSYLDKSIKAYSQYVLGVLYINEGNENEGLEYLKSVAIENLENEYKPDFYKAILIQSMNLDFDNFQKYIQLAKQDYPKEFFFEAIYGLYHAQLLNTKKANEHLIRSFQKEEVGNFFDHTEIITNINNYFLNLDENENLLFNILKETPNLNNSNIIKLGQISYNLNDVKLGDQYFDLVIERVKNPELNAKLRYLQSLFYLGKMDVSTAIDFLDRAYKLDNLNYYLLCKQYFHLINQFQQNKLSPNDFELLLEIAEKTKEGPKEVIVFLTAMSHYNLENIIESCSIIRTEENQLSRIGIKSKVFCGNSSIKTQFEESFKLVGTYMANY